MGYNWLDHVISQKVKSKAESWRGYKTSKPTLQLVSSSRKALHSKGSTAMVLNPVDTRVPKIVEKHRYLHNDK